ncbi:hypothetical protein HU200_038429 [Digitaria exilis]|uniref:Uncharacterized protein n=1 Tax=Digitaria exilis TaxID=1010633 RepID=A0A835EIH4_9POAL|nr:hypothetical protein HU200_038429 [Digitaria exilis]
MNKQRAGKCCRPVRWMQTSGANVCHLKIVVFVMLGVIYTLWQCKTLFSSL